VQADVLLQRYMSPSPRPWPSSPPTRANRTLLAGTRFCRGCLSSQRVRRPRQRECRSWPPSQADRPMRHGGRTVRAWSLQRC